MEENENGQGGGGFMEWIKTHPAIVVAVGAIVILLVVSSYLRKQTGNPSGGSASSGDSSGLTDQNGSPVVFVPTSTSFGTQTDYTASPVNSPGSTLTTGDLSNVAPGSNLTYSPSTNYAPAPTTTTTTTGLSGPDTGTLVSSIGGTIASQTPTVNTTNTTTNSNNKTGSTTTRNVGNTTTGSTTNRNIGNTTTSVQGRHNIVSTHGSSGAPVQAPGTPTVALHPANANTLVGHRAAPVSHPAIGKTPTIHATPIVSSVRSVAQKTPVNTGVSTPHPITKFPVKTTHNTLLQSGV